MDTQKKMPHADSYHIFDTITIHEQCVILERTSRKGTEILSKQQYTLLPITEDNLAKIRISKDAGLIFKHNEKIFFTAIPKNTKFLSTFTINNALEKHQCSECGRLSALPDHEGGCRKVREKSFNPSDLKECSNPAKAFKLSQRIEKYDFIIMGLESINTCLDAFIVFECKHKKNIQERPKISAMIVRKWKEDLAASWHDVSFDKF